MTRKKEDYVSDFCFAMIGIRFTYTRPYPFDGLAR
jgi:hypothetical protein